MKMCIRDSHNTDVLGRRAVAGGVVGDHQVVVDGLGHAHKAVSYTHLDVYKRQAHGSGFLSHR